MIYNSSELLSKNPLKKAKSWHTFSTKHLIKALKLKFQSNDK